MSLSLVVLAAGMGSRYGGLKQLAAVNDAGNAILDYSVYDALRAGFERIVFVIRRDIEAAFRESIGARFEGKADVRYAFQGLADLPSGFSPPPGRTKPWGTLQATLAGAALTEGAFAVINADDFYGAASYRALAQHLRSNHESAMIGFRLRNTLSDFGPVSRGLCAVIEDGLLQSTRELTKIVRDGSGARVLDEGEEMHLTGDEIVSMNMWGFTPSVIAALRISFTDFLSHHAHELESEAYLPMAVDTLVAQQHLRVRVLSSDDAWAGVTYPEDLPLVVAHIRALTQSGAYPERL
jgi:hypothetical protein